MDRAAIRQGLLEELAYLETSKNPRAEQVRAALVAHDADAVEECAEEQAAPPETAAAPPPPERAMPRKVSGARAGKEN